MTPSIDCYMVGIVLKPHGREVLRPVWVYITVAVRGSKRDLRLEPGFVQRGIELGVEGVGVRV